MDEIAQNYGSDLLFTSPNNAKKGGGIYENAIRLVFRMALSFLTI
jgi:hypothetical protein